MRIGFTYTILSLFLIAGHFVDIASTEYIYHYSKYEVTELNPIVDTLHGGFGIWIYRSIIILFFVTMLYFIKPNEDNIHQLSKISPAKFFFTIWRPKSISKSTYFKTSAFFAIFIISIDRLLAGVSNISGEVFYVSIPIFLHDFVLNGESEYLHLFATIVSLTLSIIISVSILISIYFYSRRVKGGEAPER